MESQLGIGLLATEDSTTLSYWLNWRVFICALWERSSRLNDDDAWKPCLKEIHPIWLMSFRIVALCLLLVAVSFDIALHGLELFHYYTQWTLTLFGSVISINGCIKHHKTSSGSNDRLVLGEEQGLSVHLIHGGNVNDTQRITVECKQGKNVVPGYASSWIYSFQVLFQMTAGAVMITDLVYWSVMFPFLTIRDYELNSLTVISHSLNGILLLGDTALNSLKFPWFRISYFILLTGAYVVFEWSTHACTNLWWPYPFLDLSVSYAPLWYLLVLCLHFPCYGIFAVLVKTKEYLLSRWFPESYEPLR
ncbi:hypothetical protein Leryth_025252 [Lithospermum erythrorhizon]|nr:hypothetical protein Leryth_025252 [Lithospermum erythrorhizon]